MTPLGQVTLFKCPDLIRSLVKAGADINGRQPNYFGETSFHYLSSYPSKDFNTTESLIEECRQALIENGGDPNLAPLRQF